MAKCQPQFLFYRSGILSTGLIFINYMRFSLQQDSSRHRFNLQRPTARVECSVDYKNNCAILAIKWLWTSMTLNPEMAGCLCKALLTQASRILFLDLLSYFWPTT